MKSTFLKILTLLLLGSFHIQAQELQVNTETVVYEDFSQPSIRVVLKPNGKEVKKAYKDWMKKNQDVKVDGFGFLTNKDVLVVEKEVVNKISSKKIDLYAKFETKGDYTEMYVFGALGYSIPITPQNYPVEFKNMKSMVYLFLNDYLPGYYEEKIEDTQEVVLDLKEDKTDAKDDIQDNKAEIEKLKKENKALTKRIKDYEANLKDAEAKLVKQKQNKSKVDKVIKEKN